MKVLRGKKVKRVQTNPRENSQPECRHTFGAHRAVIDISLRNIGTLQRSNVLTSSFGDHDSHEILGLISGSLIPAVLRNGLPKLGRSRCPHPLILIASRRQGAVNVELPGFSATQDNDADGLTGGQVK